MKSRLIASAGLLALALVAAPGCRPDYAIAAEPVYGHVMSVHDGDTLDVWLDSGELQRVRVACADAPELRVRGRWPDQARGQDAAALAAGLALHQRVRLEPGGVSYQRLVARVVVLAEDGRQIDLARALLKAGLAWADMRYCRVRRDAALLEALDEASRAGLGLWADAAPVAPWTWRRGQ